MSDVNENLVPVTPAAPATALAIDQGDMLAAGFDEKDYANFAQGVEFLPRLQLCGASSNLCKEGKQQIGTYAIVYDSERHLDLGKQINVFVCGLRLKALEINDDPKTGGIFSFFDPRMEEFKRIANLSTEKDTGCLAGPEFLIYLPPQKQFATLFMASKSMRNEAPSVKALLGKAATLTISLAENKKKQKWHVPKALPCSIPLDPPPLDALQAQLHKFKNPVSSAVRAAPVPVGASSGEERPQ